jgi:transposase
LNLPDIEIERVVKTEPKTIKIYVNSTKEGTECHRCAKPIDKYYARGRQIELRHLPIFGYKTYIVITPKRYVCEKCDGRPTSTQTLPWYQPRSTCTIAYEQDVMRFLINSTLEDVSMQEQIGVDAIQGILDRNIAKQIDWETIDALEVIGIDEIALKKGHRDFVVIVSGYIENELRVLGILGDREKSTVKKFFLSIPKRLRRTVKIICSDLYAGFIGAAKAVFSKHVAVCADRFHVAKLYREGLDTLRKKEMRRLRKILKKEAYGSLKNAHWIIRKRRHELSADERRIMNRLFDYSPKLREAYELCEALTAIYEMPLTKGQGKRKIKGWMQRVVNRKVTCFDRFLGTLKTHMDEITSYFIARQSSGFVEGLNNKIKVLKRRCYGITNRDHLYQRVYLDLNGYAQFGAR